MNPNASRSLVMPVIFVVAVAVAVALFVMVTSKGVFMALAFGIFVTAIIVSVTSSGAAIWCLVFAAYFEALYKGASASMFTLLVKDFFLIIAVLRLLYVSQRQRDYRWMQQPFTTAAVVFVVYCVALMFAPSTRSILLALAGFRAWVLWMPIYFPAYAFFANRQTVLRFLTLLMILELPVAVYGIIQGNIGYEHTKVIPGFYEITKWYKVDVDVNEQKKHAEAGTGEGGIDADVKPIMNVRACAIDISPGTFGTMSALVIMLSLGILASTSSPSMRFWSLATALSSAGGVLASGSRAPMFGLAAGILAMVVLSRQRVALIGGLFVLLLGAAFLLKDVSGGGAVRLTKKLAMGGAVERAMQPFNVGLAEGMSHPFGNGIATGTGMGRVFYSAGLQVAEGTHFIENEFGRALNELGVVGASTWFIMIFSLLWYCAQAIRRLGHSADAALCAGLVGGMVTIFVQLAVGQALYSAQPGIYYWIFGAAIIRLGQFSAAESNQAGASPKTKQIAPRKRRFGRVWVAAEDFPQRKLDRPAASVRRPEEKG